MRKIFIIFILLFFSIASAQAKNVKVQAVSDFSTLNPPETWELTIVDGFTMKDGTEIYSGSRIKGKIEGVTDPKRLKRNANFNFIPYEYYDSLSKRTYDIKQNYSGKYSSLTDVTAGAVIEQGAVIAGSHFISGFIGPGVALVKGAVKNEEGNRAKSAAVSVYESTPVSYINKGKELNIKKGQIFVMSFKTTDDEEEENKPNYTYTIDENIETPVVTEEESN